MSTARNPAVNQPEKFDQISTDIAYLSQCMVEYRQLINAAQEVTFERYHADPDNILGKRFPTVSQAIFRLANLVGTPSKEQRASELRQKRAAT